MTTPYRKKLIEVALPLPEINDASAYDKMPGIGPHPKGIHHWWARLPLPTARAVLFASVVDDPSQHPERFPTEEAQVAERERLFDIIRSLMQKKLHEHPEVYAAARAEMLKHCDGKLPAVYDPFAGGGSIPLEANRMGFESHAADLNPVAVLLNKCNLELAPRWTNHPPVNPEDRKSIGGTDAWRGTHGLAADVRYYGALIRDRARAKLGHLYPKVRLPKENGGGEANVIAWIWARTVTSPNPAMRSRRVPLMSTFWLSSKTNSQVWLEPRLDDRLSDGWRFEIRTGTSTKEQTARIKLGTRAGKAQDFYCLLSKEPISRDYIQAEGKAGRLGHALVAIVAEGKPNKVYVQASPEQSSVASAPSADAMLQDARSTFLSGTLPDRANITGGVCSAYGLSTWGHLFTSRQLNALLKFGDLVKDMQSEVERDARTASLTAAQAQDYARAVVTFLALTLNRCADLNNSLCTWNASDQVLRNLFKRQAIPMVWDFAEANIIGDVVGGWSTCIDRTHRCLSTMSSCRSGHARQLDAAAGANGGKDLLVSTDPPYYNNIGYAILSDFFYVWLRRVIGHVYPDVFSTLLSPKVQELTASPGRFGGDGLKAKEHFESGFRSVFTALRGKMDGRFPLTVYYAFKQDDESGGSDDEDATTSGGVDLTTGWETLLEALIASGFQVTGTWPVRASQKWRMVAMGSNALASYIVLACRARPSDAPLATRKEFMNALRSELPQALKNLQHGNIAPVDMAQSAIGPGMAVFTRYTKVIESNGSPMTVRTALGIINQVLDEVLTEQEGEFDADTRWALAWFEQFGMNEESFGTAETLSKAKNTAVNGLVEAGVVKAKGGKVRLVKRDELSEEWDPARDRRLTVWETTQHLICTLQTKGEGEAATLLNKLGGMAETARELAYRLYSICERKKWADEALAYNSLVIAWPELTKLALSQRTRQPSTQHELFS
jgi:putative DNA methylase